MPTDLTGTPTTLGIGTYNVDADAPSGLGFNEAMAQIDALIAARVNKPAGVLTGDVPVWNGTTWVRPSGTPDATKFLRGDGSWQAVAAGSLLGVQVITANGTYTPTTGTTRVWVEAVGGGGAGGGSPAAAAGNTASGGGGGSGAYSASLLTSGFSGLTATIGAGGTPVSGSTGGSGGDTSLGTAVVAKGGAGGAVSGPSAGIYGTGSAIGGLQSGGTGTLKVNGAPGGVGYQTGNQWGAGSALVIAGAGGSSRYGAGAAGLALASTQAGFAGNLYGGGGGGSVTYASGAAQLGGAGAQGVIVIWEFA